MAKRPSLANVMDKGAEPRVETPQPVTPPLEEETQTVTARRKPGKKKLGWVQINMYVPEELRTRAKVKALQEGRDLSDIGKELLEVWIEKG